MLKVSCRVSPDVCLIACLFQLILSVLECYFLIIILSLSDIRQKNVPDGSVLSSLGAQETW